MMSYLGYVKDLIQGINLTIRPFCDSKSNIQ